MLEPPQIFTVVCIALLTVTTMCLNLDFLIVSHYNHLLNISEILY